MMQLNRILVLSFLFIWLSISLLSQPNKYGVPIITNYPHYITGGSEQNWCITQDARGVMYIGNNDKGVLEYDGVVWRTIPVPNNPIIRSLVTGDDGVVYVGGESEFGYLAPDQIGNMQYHSLSDTIDQENDPFTAVWRIYFDQGKVYFCTFATIFIYNTELNEISTVNTTEYAFYSFLIDNTLYVSDFGSGLMKFENDQFVLVPGGEFFKELTITGMAKYDDMNLLVGTYEQGVYLFNIKSGMVDHSFLDPELKDHFTNGAITYIRPQKENFVVASLYNGLVILDRNGKALEIISKADGLIDENIPFVYSNDQLNGSGPLWIANYMGVSKLETNIPIRQFTETSGFKGFITDIEVFNDQLFISTFNGLHFKSRISSTTSFFPVPEIHNEEIRNLNVIHPSPNVDLLVASSDHKTFVIDKQLKVSTLADLVINPHKGRSEREEYSGLNIVQDPKNPDIIYTGRGQIVGLQYINGKWKEIMRTMNLPGEQILTMVIDKYGYLWTSTGRMVMRIDISRLNDTGLKYLSQEDGQPAGEEYNIFLDPENKEVLLGTTDGFYKYNYFRDTVYRDTFYNSVLPPGKNQIMTFHEDHDGDFWYSFENEYTGWNQLAARRTGNILEVIHDKPFQRLPNTSTDLFYSDPEQGVWFGKSNVLYYFDKSFSRDYSSPFQALIRSVTINKDSLLFGGTNFKEDNQGNYKVHLSQDDGTQPLIHHRYNNFAFSWTAPFFEQEEKLLYSYMLEGFDNEWSEWKDAVYMEFANLPFGSYTMHVKALNVYGYESLPASYSFTVIRPWYTSFVAIIAYILISGLIVYIIIKLYTRRLKRENIRLEGIIQERTSKIRKQKDELVQHNDELEQLNEELEQLNEEISAQRDEIEAQRDQLVVHRDLLASQNKDITDSINYAQRIQSAILPSQSYMDSLIPEYFIFYKPRDIVSGDFYWIKEIKNRLIIVGADCTGHGIPGAFMSMLGVTLLNDLVVSTSIDQPAEILGQLRVKVKEMMAQQGKMEDQKDGMDMTIVIIHRDSHELQFAGAYNPLYIIRKKESIQEEKLDRYASMDNLDFQLFELKADKQPVGTHWEETDFTNHTIQLQNQDAIYIFSDGMIDQFGGEKRKKFKSLNFKKLLLSVQEESMEKQKQLIENTFETWRGDCEQIDDVCVIGVRI